MSNRQVALIRGINVGRAKRIAMADLRKLVEGFGYRDVQTLLNSGNVVFDAPARTSAKTAAAKIEAGIADELGIAARVTVVTAKELSAIVADNPLLKVATDPSRLLVAVLMHSTPRTRFDEFADQDWAPDVFAAGERAAYMWCSKGILESRLAETFGRRMGDAATARNWATILKLHALAPK